MDVNAIQQRTGNPLLVFRDCRRRAGARLDGVIKPAARAGIYTIGHIFLAR